MLTKLHRLYKSRLAQTYKDLPEDMQVVQDQMEEAGGPVKIKYEEDEIYSGAYSGNIQAISYAVTIRGGHKVLLLDNIISILVYIAGIGCYSISHDNEVTVASQYRYTDEDLNRQIDTIVQRGASKRPVTEEEVQLVQNIINHHNNLNYNDDDDDIESRHLIPPFFKRMNVNSKLHRLYKSRLAQTYKDLPEDMQVVQDQMEEAGGPVKIRYEEDEEPKLWKTPRIHGPRIMEPSYAVTVVDGHMTLLVDNIGSELDQLEIYIAGRGCYIIGRNNEVGTTSQHQYTSEQISRYVNTIVERGATERRPTEEEIQLVRNIIGGDDVGQHTLPPFFKRMDINCVDEPEILEDTHQLSMPEEYPSGESDDSYHTRPGLDGPGHNLPRIEGSKDFSEFEEIEKEAGGFGMSLHELITPSKGQGFTDNPADNHQTENLSEDPDLKLGEVEEPYSEQGGPQSFQFEDDSKYNIVKGADPDNKEAVGIPDQGMNENGYTEGYNRQDSAIPRGAANTSISNFTGWILPDGNLLPVDIFGPLSLPHLDTARENGCPDPIKAGWLHMRNGNPEPVSSLTKRQMDKLVQIILASKRKAPWWLSDVSVVE